MPHAVPQAADPTGQTAHGWRRALLSIPSGLWVFIDQGIVSLSNFAAPVLVARSGQEELGFFMLGFSIYMFAIGLGRAAVWTAFTRRCPQLPAEERAAYAGSATIHLLAFTALAVLLILAVAGVAWAVGAVRYAGLLVVVAPCIGVMLLREHARRLDLARHDFFEVFGFDTVVSVMQVALLAWLAWSERLTATTAFLSLATTSMLAIPWLLVFRRHTWLVQWSRVIPDWRENWSITKWLTGGSAAVLLGKEGYSWLLSAVYTIAELGRLGAGRIIVQATNPLVIGGSNYLGPVSARVYAEDGIRGLWRYTVRTSTLMALAIAVFLLLVGVCGLPVVQTVMTKSAAGVTTTLLLTYSAGILSEALLIPIEYASVNLGHAQLMFKTAIVRLAINVSIGFGLVGVFGAEAIGVGMLLGSLVALTWQWSVLAGEVRRV